MNLRQRKKYNMYVQVNYFLNKHASELSDMQRIAAVKPDLEQLIKDIDEKEGFILEDISGYAVTKKKLRADLTDITFTIAKALNKYGSNNSNPDMINWTRHPGSYYIRLTDVDLWFYAFKFNFWAQPIETQLSVYGITADDILLLKNFQEKFMMESDEPEFQKELRADARKEQAKIFKDADALLNEKMDGYVASFRFSSPELYLGYTLARRQK
jgi:hypothetical protein